jgi:DNA-binding MarR family transcriptional regulator
MWDALDPRDTDSRDRDPFDTRRAEPVHPRDVFAQELDLPHGAERGRVYVYDQEYDLRGSEVRTLATLGTFRVVPVRDLDDDRGRAPDLWHGDLDRLRSAGLIQVAGRLGDERGTPILTLTDRGRELLETHQAADRTPAHTFAAGVLKSRELAHDAQLYRAYRRSAERLTAQGARIRRVIVEHELKREYQRFLQERNRDRSDSDGRPDRTPLEIEDWAREHQLPTDDGSVQFPDVRIEYEHPDGRRDVEDVEVTTPHYRGAHAAGKAAAGFTRYRARGGRLGGSSGRGGRRSSDITLAEEILD